VYPRIEARESGLSYKGFMPMTVEIKGSKFWESYYRPMKKLFIDIIERSLQL
jgi:hypothetical protein